MQHINEDVPAAEERGRGKRRAHGRVDATAIEGKRLAELLAQNCGEEEG